MQERRRQFLAAVTAGVAGSLAGCGGTGEETATAVRTDTETATGTETPTATATETPTATDEADQTVVVGVDGSLRFDPETFEIAVGDTVRWEWDGGGHNVRPDSVPEGSDWTGTAGDGGDTYGSGHVHTVTFETAGQYSYYCAPHRSAGMDGTFTVTES
jgi:plastocyanin